MANFTAEVTDYFGPAYPKIAAFADLLVHDGIERGLLGPREADRIWDRHLLNCAGVCEVLPQTGTLLDLGSGAGLPGIVVAIMRPKQRVVLLESLLRRTNWLTEVAEKLSLSNVEVIRGRAGENLLLPKVAAVTARAVAPMEKLMAWSAPLLTAKGTLFALKGENAAEELSGLTKGSEAAKLRRIWDVTDASVVQVETIPGVTPTTIARVSKRA